MAWTEKDVARRARKLLNNGLYEPEDVTPNEFRLIRKFYPELGLYLQFFYEQRAEKISKGEWTEEHEPPDNDRRIKNYENGKGVVKPP